MRRPCADPHLGNVLTGPDAQVWLVGWDDVMLAPRELDLMFAIGGVLAFAPVTERQQAWFFEGCGPVDLDQDRLSYYRCTRALVDLLEPAAEVLTRPERAETALAIVRDVLSPTGLVRQALA